MSVRLKTFYPNSADTKRRERTLVVAAWSRCVSAEGEDIIVKRKNLVMTGLGETDPGSPTILLLNRLFAGLAVYCGNRAIRFTFDSLIMSIKASPACTLLR